MTNIAGGARLDLYDMGRGAVLLAWTELLNPGAASYNIYDRIVTYTPIYTPPNAPPGGVFGPLDPFKESFGPWALLANVTSSGGFFSLETGVGGFELESGGGLFELESNAQAWQFTVTGLQIASYNSGAGVKTPSLTYEFKAVAVQGGVEVCATGARKITPGPASIMLTTPMKRLWPFPNTGLD